MKYEQQVACGIAATVRDRSKDLLISGVSTLSVTKQLATMVKELGGTSGTLGYGGFPDHVCISVNDGIAHGFGKEDEILKDGDVVKIDVVVKYRGWFGDTAYTYVVGGAKAYPDIHKFLKTVERALLGSLSVIRAGISVRCIGRTLDKEISSKGYTTIRGLSGHGIGQQVHQEPRVESYDEPTNDYILQEGDVIAVEPLVSMGKGGGIVLDNDGFLWRTSDKSIAAHFEHTIEVLKEGYKIWT